MSRAITDEEIEKETPEETRAALAEFTRKNRYLFSERKPSPIVLAYNEVAAETHAKGEMMFATVPETVERAMREDGLKKKTL